MGPALRHLTKRSLGAEASRGDLPGPRPLNQVGLIAAALDFSWGGYRLEEHPEKDIGMSISAFAYPSPWVGLVASVFLAACPRWSPEPKLNDFVAPGLDVSGKQLFADRLLSRDSSISCASCHVPAIAFADTLPIAHGTGADARRRNSASLLNVDIHPHYGWNGRATTLREHVEHAFTERGDMGITVEQAADRLGRLSDRRRAFAAAGRVPDGTAVADALVAYQMTLKEGDSRFDRF